MPPVAEELYQAVIDTGPITPLNSAYEIEDALNMLKKLEVDIDFLKGLKKHRVEQIDAEINEKNSRVDRLRDVILKTMQTHEPDQKTLHFPSVGKVSRRSIKECLEIEDEESLLEFFDEVGRRKEVTKVKESIDTKAAKALAETYLDQGRDVPGVHKVEAKEGVTISFTDAAQDAAPAKKAVGKVVAQPAGRKALDANDLDELDL